MATKRAKRSSTKSKAASYRRVLRFPQVKGKIIERVELSLSAGGGSLFLCRQCQGLAYESQNETAHSRALSKTQAIRVKLGGEPGLIYDFPSKPKGMHWRTYWRLKQEADEAEDRSWPPWVFRMVARCD